MEAGKKRRRRQIVHAAARAAKVQRIQSPLAAEPIHMVSSPKDPIDPWHPTLINTGLNITLREHQARGVEFMKGNVRGIIAWFGVGTGKTEFGIAVAHALKLWTIVIVTKSTEQQWIDRVKKVGADLRQFKFYTEESFLKRGVPFCNQEHLLIVDEVQRFRTAGKKKSTAITECAHRAAKVVLLTGTPIMNSPLDLAVLVNMITTQDTMPVEQKEWIRVHGVDGLKNLPLLHQQLRCKFSYYLQDENNPNFPKLEFYTVNMKMTAEHQKIYDRTEANDLTGLAKQFQLPVGDVPEFVFRRFNPEINLQAFLNGVRSVSNHVAVKKEDTTLVYQPKVDAIVEAVLEEAKRGGQQMIYSGYNENGLDPLQRTLEHQASVKGVPVMYGRIDGSTSAARRAELQRLYNSRRIQILLFGGAGGVGMDMKNTSQMHFLEYPWLETHIQQAVGRARRDGSHPPGSTVKIFFYELERDPELYPADDPRRERPSVDQHVRDLNRKRDAINKTFIEHILQDSIENNPGCKTQDFPLPAQAAPALLMDLVAPLPPTPRADIAMLLGAPCLGTDVSIEALKQVMPLYAVNVPPELWSRSLEEICKELAHMWPSKCFSGKWLPKRFIGLGRNGAVYLMCEADKCERVAKIQLLTPDTDPLKIETFPLADGHKIETIPLRAVMKEVDMQRKVGPTLAPALYKAQVCRLPAVQSKDSRKIIVIEMELFSGHLKQFWRRRKAQLQTGTDLTEHGKRYVRYWGSMIRALHRLGVYHNDLHIGNLLYKTVEKDGKRKERFVISDYGRATETYQDRTDDFLTLAKSLSEESKIPTSVFLALLKKE